MVDEESRPGNRAKLTASIQVAEMSLAGENVTLEKNVGDTQHPDRPSTRTSFSDTTASASSHAARQ